MSAEEPAENNGDEPPRRFPRISREDVEARAKQARAKTEFILSRAYGLFRDPKLMGLAG